MLKRSDVTGRATLPDPGKGPAAIVPSDAADGPAGSDDQYRSRSASTDGADGAADRGTQVMGGPWPCHESAGDPEQTLMAGT